MTATRVAVSRLAGRTAGYAREVRSYWGEAETATDFVKIMRVRLSKSKVGKLVCPNRITVVVGLRTLGPEVVLRSHTTDISVLEELIIGGGYAVAVEHTAKPVRTIIDLGANTGLAARWLLAANPTSTIVCVEPEEGNVAALRRNLAAVMVPYHVFQVCIGGSERRVSLTTANGEFAYSMRDAGATAVEATIEVITMDRLLRDTGIVDIDLLKCDIEGAEQELFADCSSWISKVRVAVVECHGQFDALQLVDMLGRNGSSFEIVDRELNPAFECEVATIRNVAYLDT